MPKCKKDLESILEMINPDQILVEVVKRDLKIKRISFVENL